MSVIVNDKSLVAQRIQITGADHPKFEVLLSVPDQWEEMATLWDEKIPFDAEDHQNISRFICESGIKDLYVPNPGQFNGEVLLPEIFARDGEERLHHAKGVTRLWGRTCFADGCLLPCRGTGNMIRAGGCPMLVACREEVLACTHAGFYSLIDRGYIASNRTIGRRWSSVIDSLLFALGAKTPKQRQAVHLWVFYSIRPEDFFHSLEDENYRRHNEILLLYFKECGYTCFYMDGPRMHFNLPQLAREQALSRGVLDGNIHLENAFLPEHYPTTRRGKGNYLVAVKRFDNMPKTRHK